jgi:hypothetical protein
MKRQRRTFSFSWSKQKTITLIITIAIVGAWWRFYCFIEEHYGHQYAIALTALLVASIAAIGTWLSLKWTRDTIRPFLYTAGSINVEKVGEHRNLVFNIQNSGSLPGEDVQTEIDFFDEDEEVTEENLSNKYVPPTRETAHSILFPNSSYYEKYILDLNQKNDLELWDNIGKGKTKCRVRIMYKSLGREHVTITTEKLEKREWEETIVTTPIPPQKWK